MSFLYGFLVVLIPTVFATEHALLFENGCSDSVEASCCFEDTTLKCSKLICPDSLQELLNNPCLEYRKLVITNSNLSYLPEVEKGKLKGVHDLDIIDSTLDSFIPPTGRRSNGKNRSFFESLKIRNVNIMGVSSLQSLDWSWISTCQKLRVENSQFLRIPENFGGPENLYRITVRSSMVEKIHKNAFPQSSLFSLDLSNNSLEYLESGTFSALAETEIDLSHNKLKTLPSNLFPYANVDEVRPTLSLSHNPITDLERDTFSKFRFHTIYLEGTQLKCDCKYIWLLDQARDVIGNCHSDGGQEAIAVFLHKCSGIIQSDVGS